MRKTAVSSRRRCCCRHPSCSTSRPHGSLSTTLDTDVAHDTRMTPGRRAVHTCNLSAPLGGDLEPQRRDRGVAVI
eukprot:scaffold44813_cov62-Phaeocystis_antarctica.AAC.4